MKLDPQLSESLGCLAEAVGLAILLIALKFCGWAVMALAILLGIALFVFVVLWAS